ncbi:MAG TPA: lysophospholipid acyltransferase family protein [Dehalococcoidia bacterium]|nr:lysophospholipid acyltransferase family protein [Dehalococcoidia bacterium]
MPAFYFCMSRLLALALWSLGHWRVTGANRMPHHGAVIVVANHLNLIDPPLLAASLPRRIRFMAKQELFDSRAGVFIRLYGSFPVRRFEADLQALRTARRLLDGGEVLGMFPEGHRSGGAGMIAAHPGTALIALQSGAPVLPVAITGSEQIRSPSVLVRRARITVTVGEPFVLPRSSRIDAAAVEQASQRIMRSIAELLPARYRGVYTYGEVN